MINTSNDRNELIAFRIEDQEYSVDIMSVREIRGWTAATPLPQSPDYVRGVINLRGTVLPIVDLSARLGLGTVEPTPRHVIIVVHIGKRIVGLLVDAVSDILAVNDDALQPVPDVACNIVQSFLSAIITIEDRMISLVSLDKILPEEELVAA
ncbi:MAG: chemotaxis protein CheW [Hirschia sp.]|nr:chemotaxis protein CheW [Hirschia sp.]MBF18439.1 chemotaxis protein CheW [Hirschia sp.]|tara:strand:+ start:28 stop:483 length:456 start_codon:yes stop_codon:yes gene_type:complete